MKFLFITALCVLTVVDGGYAASVRGSFQCACNTDHCRNENRTTCEDAMCYTQYLKKRDGADPITKGCLPTKTSLLCENRRPKTAANWPILVCCEKNMCNDQLPPQLAQIMGVYQHAGAGNVTAAAGSTIASNDLASNTLSRNSNGDRTSAGNTNDLSSSSSSRTGSVSNNNGDVIEDPRDEEAEIDFNPSGSANQDLSGSSDPADTSSLADSNKIYNNPRFMDTIKRKTTISGSSASGSAGGGNGVSDLNVLRPVPADSSATGLTAFHVAVLLTALACLFLLFLLGFAILRRQARFFNGTPYLVGQPVYTKEQTTLTRHDHNCVATPTRLPLPSHHSYAVGVTVPSSMHHHQAPTIVSQMSTSRGSSHHGGSHLQQQQQRQKQYQSVITASTASYDNNVHS